MTPRKTPPARATTGKKRALGSGAKAKPDGKAPAAEPPRAAPPPVVEATPVQAVDPAVLARWRSEPWERVLAARALPPLGLDSLRPPFTAADVAARLGVRPDELSGMSGLAGASLGLSTDRDQLRLQATDGASTADWGARLDERWGRRREFATKQGWVSDDERWAAIFDAFFLVTFVPLVSLDASFAQICELVPALWRAPKTSFDARPGVRGDTLRLPATAADPVTSTTIAVFDEDDDEEIDRIRIMIAAQPEFRARALERLVAQPGVTDTPGGGAGQRRVTIGGVAFTVTERFALHLDTEGA